MKKVMLLSLITSLLIVGCTQQLENSIPQGAWKLVEGQQIIDGKTVVYFPGLYTGYEYKMWSDNHFMWVAEYSQDTNSYAVHGAGTYTINGNQYVENVLYNTNNMNIVGRTLNMTLEILNDTLVQSFHPVDSLGQVVENTLNVEKYMRWE